MNPFKKVTANPNAERDAALVKKLISKHPELSEAEAKKVVDDEVNLNIVNLWANDQYQVIIRDAEIEKESGFPEMLWLSIKRLDKEPIHDWRDLQKIKNMLVGEENEGVEVYPAESRLVDTANQYHIWVLKDNQLKFPFGFTARAVADADEAVCVGAKQRGF